LGTGPGPVGPGIPAHSSCRTAPESAENIAPEAAKAGKLRIKAIFS
jgi:hypothetical protein